jgi:enoyl-CoA hydratase
MTEIRLDSDGPVRILTLDAPGRRNALVPSMVAALTGACDEIDADPGAGAVVVRATGPAFCAGAHRDLLAAAGADPASDQNVSALTAVYGAFTRVGRLLPPVVAAVRGDAVGAGVNLVLAADLRVIARSARIVTGFLDLGLHPGGGHFTLMGRAVGRSATAALSLFGEPITGERAAALGLAWEAVDADEVEPRALELAHRAGREPGLARAMAASFRDQLGPPGVPWPLALEAERGAQMWSLRNTARFPRS